MNLLCFYEIVVLKDERRSMKLRIRISGLNSINDSVLLIPV